MAADCFQVGLRGDEELVPLQAEAAGPARPRRGHRARRGRRRPRGPGLSRPRPWHPRRAALPRTSRPTTSNLLVDGLYRPYPYQPRSGTSEVSEAETTRRRSWPAVRLGVCLQCKLRKLPRDPFRRAARQAWLWPFTSETKSLSSVKFPMHAACYVIGVPTIN